VPDQLTVANSRDGALDTLRGLAAFLVLLNHVGVPMAVFPIGDFGRIGVLLFFCISGIVYFYPLIKVRKEKIDLNNSFPL